MTHPSSLVLESFAVGEPLTAVHAAHVATCAACAAFVEELRGLASGGPSATSEADAAVAKALAGLGGERVIAIGTKREETRAGESVGSSARMNARRRRLWVLATSVLTPLAAAAAILLLARGAPLPSSPNGPTITTATATTPTRTPRAPIEAPLATAAPVEPDTQFKGGMQVAVVRERGGKQERFSSTVRVRPGDRLRVEVALDREQAILGAVLADDGSYIELMPLGTRGPGTHFSERSAKIDGSPTRGTILIGSPEAVARARATRLLVGVDALRVEWEAP